MQTIYADFMQKTEYLNHNNEILSDIIINLEKIINILNKNTINSTINSISNLIIMMNRIYDKNKNYLDKINKEVEQLYLNSNDFSSMKTIKMKDGKYKGQLKNNKKEGKGLFIYNNHNIYEGEFKNDKKDGKGILKYNDGTIYDGEWKEGLKEGRGILVSSNGYIFQGEFKDDSLNGFGIIYNPNGEKYIGTFMDDKKDGYGIQYNKNDSIEFLIKFSDGKKVKTFKPNF